MEVPLGGSKEDQIAAAKGVVETIAGFAGYTLSTGPSERVGCESDDPIVHGWVGEPVYRV